MKRRETSFDCSTLLPAEACPLLEYLGRGIREARHAVKLTTAMGFKDDSTPAFWRGQVAALVRVRRQVRRMVKAGMPAGNVQHQRPATEDVQNG